MAACIKRCPAPSGAQKRRTSAGSYVGGRQEVRAAKLLALTGSRDLDWMSIRSSSGLEMRFW